MRLIVEFYGLARHLTGAKETTVEVATNSSLRDVATALGHLYPQLVGPLIEPQTSSLREPYVFSIDGRSVPTSLDVAVDPGERLVLMFVPAGG
ncbi:MAG: MoaD/ThiS family protein [Dehalococcoidales bacterium]|nr:MoaD/ThiS family protein [Dehalococcoidales bacterium]